MLRNWSRKKMTWTIVITVLLSFETVRRALGRLLMRRPAEETGQ